MSDYPAILNTIKFHKFEWFRRPQNPYVLAWMRDFYIAYEQALQKKRKITVCKPLDEVEVHGKMVQCHTGEINTALDTLENDPHMFNLRM